MGFDKGRKGDRGGRGRDKRDSFGDEPAFGGDFGGGFQERGGYGGGGRGGYGGGGGGGLEPARLGELAADSLDLVGRQVHQLLQGRDDLRTIDDLLRDEVDAEAGL